MTYRVLPYAVELRHGEQTVLLQGDDERAFLDTLAHIERANYPFGCWANAEQAQDNLIGSYFPADSA